MPEPRTSIAANAPLTAAEAQSLAERVAEEMFSRDRASQAMGIRIARVGPGRAELTMTVRVCLQQRQHDDGRFRVQHRLRRTGT